MRTNCLRYIAERLLSNETCETVKYGLIRIEMRPVDSYFPRVKRFQVS